MKRLQVSVLFLLLLARSLPAYDAWLVPIGDKTYAETEDLFIASGRVPPFMETPVAGETMRSRLVELSREGSVETARDADGILASMRLPRTAFSFFLDAGFHLGTLNDPWLYRQIPNSKYDPTAKTWLDGGTVFTDYNGIYQVLELPPLLSMGVLAHSEHFSVLFNPEIRASSFELLMDYGYTNIPKNLARFDLNFPYRGIATFWSGEFEARVGRDKLNLGPGRWSTLTVNRNMPYFDYGMASFHVPGFSFSAYLLRLNPVLSSDEDAYVEAIISGAETNMEQNSYYYDTLSNIRSKTLTVGRALFAPFPWLAIMLQQTLLMGGRYPQLTDLNPLILFHNLFMEGFYSVPASLAFGVTPLPGLYLYGEYLLYDVAFGDEGQEVAGNPSAGAYQLGLTALSRPWLDLGPGRLRLDCEWSYASPWAYNKYLSQRKLTSRFVFVEPFAGRFWVDFPLGFYRGPDCWELNTKLSYGTPGHWEAFFLWRHTEKGEVDMYGYGKGSDYAHSVDFTLNGLTTGIPEIQDALSVEGSWNPFSQLGLQMRIRWTNVRNANHAAGTDASYFDAGATVRWSIQ